jgi:hypothetical protein
MPISGRDMEFCSSIDQINMFISVKNFHYISNERKTSHVAFDIKDTFLSSPPEAKYSFHPQRSILIAPNLPSQSSAPPPMLIF